MAVHEEWLALALAEVVENAAGFSTPGSPITVVGTTSGGIYRITVSDRGPGLSKEQRAAIGAFTQFDRDLREQQGLGLGLAIARLATRLWRGELSLKAGPEKCGLQVQFSLPTN